MKEWWIFFEFSDAYEEENVIILPSYWKVLRWFFLTAWKCRHIEIAVSYKGGNDETYK